MQSADSLAPGAPWQTLDAVQFRDTVAPTSPAIGQAGAVVFGQRSGVRAVDRVAIDAARTLCVGRLRIWISAYIGTL